MRSFNFLYLYTFTSSNILYYYEKLCYKYMAEESHISDQLEALYETPSIMADYIIFLILTKKKLI